MKFWEAALCRSLVPNRCPVVYRHSCWLLNAERPDDFFFGPDEFDHEFLRFVSRLDPRFESLESLNESRPHWIYRFEASVALSNAATLASTSSSSIALLAKLMMDSVCNRHPLKRRTVCSLKGRRTKNRSFPNTGRRPGKARV